MPASGVTLTANFSVAPPAPSAYYLTVDTAAGGTTSGTGITARRAGDPISVTATANANYIFRYWIVTDSSGTFVDGSTANPAVFDMPANNVTLTPYFVPYNNFTVNVSPQEGGTVTGSETGQYRVGTPISVTPAPNSGAGYSFIGWSVSGVAITGGSQADPATFNMPANAVTLTANFSLEPPPSAPATYTLTIDPNPANGRITGTATGEYDEGAAIQAKAIADRGYEFAGWTVTGAEITGGNIVNPATFSMPANAVTLTATFAALPPPMPIYFLTVNTAAGGTASETGITARRAGDPISVTATANANYTFRYWIVTGGGSAFPDGSTENPAVFDMPENDVTLRPYFVPFNDLTVVVEGGGMVYGTGFIDITTTETIKYRVGTPIDIVAAPDPGYIFKGWTITGAAITGGNNANPAPFNMPANAVTLTASFELLQLEPTPTPPAADTGQNATPTPTPTATPTPEGYGGDVSHMLDKDNHIQYIRGVGDNLFEPERDMTRAEVAQMFFNLLLKKDVEITVRFPDETAGAWHEKAVHTMASLGILTGYADGGVHPGDSITRAEFVTMAVRFARAMPEDPELSRFSDVPASHWAYSYINAAVQFGWIKGYEDGAFRPSSRISRAEAVTIVNRMLGRVADKEYIDSHPGIEQFSDVPKTYWAYYDICEAHIAHEYDMRNGAEKWRE